MAKINVLTPEIANLIAAGEVVERPSSVLKELIENSIDSGATKIVAEIKRGGVALIRVTDNGCGIEKDDLPISLKRHATSKIREKDDLDAICTLGFRGEALAAISSVSVLTIISKTKDSKSATMLTAEAGNVVDISEVGASDGTTVVVENLFYNVPARRKFLKKDATEAMNVAALVEKVALSRPDISIQLLIDGEERFKTPGNNDLLSTVYAVLGKEFSNKLIKADGSVGSVRVHGFIGRSDNVKKNRNLQNVFINGRYVKSLTAMAAIEKAYTSYIAPEAFPCCVLFIDMNPSLVDVNVHPTKLEVKFSDERVIFEAVYYTVKSALEEHEYRPEMELSQRKKGDFNPASAYVPLGADTKGKQISLNSAIRGDYTAAYTAKADKFEKPVSFSSGVGNNTAAKYTSKSRISEYDTARKMTPQESIKILDTYREEKPKQVDTQKEISNVKPKVEPEIPAYKIIGEAFNCYIILECEDYILLIDKHAGHERVIFEDLKAVTEREGKVGMQSLVLPLSVSLSPTELSAILEFGDDIRAVGFEFNFNMKVADITAIPNAISINDAESLFIRMADEIANGVGNPENTEKIRREKALYQVACKAAIKGGRVYDDSITEWLVKKLLTLPDITVCPHGRPIAYKLTKSELDRQFERLK